MEFTSLIKRDRIKNTFEQIDNAINQLKEWNADVNSAEALISTAPPVAGYNFEFSQLMN